MKRNCLLSILVFFLGSFLISGQEIYREHIVLDTDRDIYISGENIWFYAQCNNSFNHADSLLSRILYLELYDQKHNTISKSKVRIIRGSATGSIPIPAGINTGNYFLRAYTQYSRNFPPAMICTSLLCIVNPSKPLPSDEIVDYEYILVVPGQEKFATGKNNIALRMTPQLAKNTSSVVLADETGNQISEVKPFENGLCLLEFDLHALPASLLITVKQLNGKEITRKLPTDTITSFRPNPEYMQNLQNRFFGSKPGIALTTNKKEYNKREPVQVSLSAISKLSQPLFISVSAHDGKFEKKNLLPWYLAYNPVLLQNYLDHLSVISDSLKKQLEILGILYSMHFKDSEISDVKNFWPPEMRDAGISGIIRNKQNGKPMADMLVYAAVADEKNQVHIYKTNEDGRFYFTLNHLNGMHNVYITPGQSDSANLEILISSDFESSYPAYTELVPFVPDSSDIGLLNRLSRNASLCSIYSKHAVEEKKVSHFSALPVVPQENITKISDYIEMPVMTEIFSEIIPFVTVKKKNNHYYFQVFDESTGVTYNDPLVLLDGLPLFDYDKLMQVSTDQVESVELTNKVLYLGNFTINGMISIHSKTNDFAGIKLPAASRFLEYQGITEESIPVFPVYREGDTDRNPDFRTLLLWERITPGKPITFSTSDHSGDFTITVIAGNRRNSADFYVKPN